MLVSLASVSTSVLALALIVLAVTLAFQGYKRIVTVPVDTNPRYKKKPCVIESPKRCQFQSQYWLGARRNICSAVTVLVFCIAILTVAIIGAIGADVRIGRIARS